MPTYNFIVARFIPDLIKNEPVNIGIIVNDAETNESYGRFVENFRPLISRYRESNISALKDIVESFRGKDKSKFKKSLEDISKNNQYQLRFTEPRAIKAGDPSRAIRLLYDQYISIESKIRKRKVLTKIQLRGMITKGIEQIQFEKEWIKSRPRIEGTIGHFTFDYGFKNGKINDLMHSISFAGNAKNAYTDAKALAISVEDALSKDEDLNCTAIIHPPSNEKNHRDFYEPAVGYLVDKECTVKDEDGIHPCLLQIKDKLTRLH